MTTAITGRKDQATRLAATLAAGGLHPNEVSVCGPVVSARFRGPEPAHEAARLFALAGFHKARVVESIDYAKDQQHRKTIGPKVIRAWVATARV